MLKAIVFDFDGVIADSEPLHFRAFVEIARPIGFNLDWPRYLRELIGYDDRDAIRAMLREVGRPDDEARVTELCTHKQQVIDRLIAEGVPTIPGARELIEAAHGDGMPIAIASGATARDIEQMLDGLGLRGHFRAIVSADDVHQSKPHPMTYRLAAERLGIEPGHCLAIEDTALGLRSARGAGMMTLGLTTTADAGALRDAQRVEADLADVTLTKLHEWYG